MDKSTYVMQQRYYKECFEYARGINVSCETFEKFDAYYSILKKWQKSLNIVSQHSFDFFWDRHILDSLQLVPLLGEVQTVLDIGSGGGFPGMVIAIATNKSVFCIDSDKRKALFLMEVARLVDVNVTVINSRIECLTKYDFDAVCARGFSSLDQLIMLANKHSKNKEGFFLKGAKYEQEVLEAKKRFAFSCEIIKSVSSDDGAIIHVHSIMSKS